MNHRDVQCSAVLVLGRPGVVSTAPARCPYKQHSTTSLVVQFQQENLWPKLGPKLGTRTNTAYGTSYCGIRCGAKSAGLKVAGLNSMQTRFLCDYASIYCLSCIFEGKWLNEEKENDDVTLPMATSEHSKAQSYSLATKATHMQKKRRNANAPHATKTYEPPSFIA